MSSPYKPGAVQSSSAGVPSGFVALTLAEYAVLAQILALFPFMVYEPVCEDTGELLFDDSGDVLMDMSGEEYAS